VTDEPAFQITWCGASWNEWRRRVQI